MKLKGTQSLCDTYGIWTEDELLLLEDVAPVVKRSSELITQVRAYDDRA